MESGSAEPGLAGLVFFLETNKTPINSVSATRPLERIYLDEAPLPEGTLPLIDAHDRVQSALSTGHSC